MTEQLSPAAQLDLEWLLEQAAIEDADKTRLAMLAPVEEEPKPEPSVFEAIGLEMRKLANRIESLEESAITYAGTWQADRAYKPNSQVTDKGATWIARVACAEGSRPGDGPNWRLTAKSPRGKA